VDADGVPTYANPAFCRMTGWSAAELLALREPFPFWPPEELEENRRAFAQTLRGEAPPEGFDLRYQRRDGERFDVHVLVAPLASPEGGRAGWLSSVHDVTARRAAEDALRRSRAQLAEVQRLAQVGGWEWDVASGRVWWSDELYAMFGLPSSSQALTYQAFLERVHPEDRERVADVVEGAARRGEPFEMEHRIVRPDGEMRVVLGRGHVDVQGDGRLRRMVGTAQDVTERKRAEEERASLLQAQAARAQAEEANRLKDEFLATLSHELRTPLNAIVGWASLMSTGNLDDATRQKAVQTISNAARALTQLIADVLDVSRISAGKVQLSLRTVELARVAEAALDTVKPAAQARRVRLSLKVDEDAADACVLGDPDRLQQVVWNLLSNAVKFTPAEGSVDVRVAQDRGEATITVTDTGVGIAPTFLPHVFDRFRQADSGSRRAFGGLGLGLSIARHLAEAHGGRLYAASQGEGRGATFTLRVPALAGAARAASEVATVEADPWANAPGLGGVRVLAVEDDLASREMLGAMLRRLGAEVVLAQSAAEGYAMLQQYRPDVLLSDIEMPGENGYELMRRVRALAPADGGMTPAAAITAHVGPEDRVKALAAGFGLHVAKPVQPADVAMAVAALAARVRRGPGSGLVSAVYAAGVRSVVGYLRPGPVQTESALERDPRRAQQTPAHPLRPARVDEVHLVPVRQRGVEIVDDHVQREHVGRGLEPVHVVAFRGDGREVPGPRQPLHAGPQDEMVGLVVHTVVVPEASLAGEHHVQRHHVPMAVRDDRRPPPQREDLGRERGLAAETRQRNALDPGAVEGPLDRASQSIQVHEPHELRERDVVEQPLRVGLPLTRGDPSRRDVGAGRLQPPQPRRGRREEVALEAQLQDRKRGQQLAPGQDRPHPSIVGPGVRSVVGCLRPQDPVQARAAPPALTGQGESRRAPGGDPEHVPHVLACRVRVAAQPIGHE
jgi:PAS domain S-box-containing protein